MSKIIKVTPEIFEECMTSFEESVKGKPLFDGKVSFSKVFSTDEKATVYFTSEAWTKMVVLIQDFSDEVAWHGLAKRVEESELNEYLIYDILVYPQEVTGATVNTDQAEYETWIMNQEDEVFNNIRMQGHSHVNMPPSPSGVDLSHQEKILGQLKDDMFYIFMIWNKSFKHEVKIYDLEKNVLFENSDVAVKLLDTGGIDEFLADAKEKVKKRAYVYSSTFNKNTQVTTQPKTEPAKIEAPKSAAFDEKTEEKKKVSITSLYDDDDDFYDRFGGRGRHFYY